MSSELSTENDNYRVIQPIKPPYEKVFLFCAALLFAGGVMAQNESKWRELARRDYEQCLAKFDSLQRVWPQMSDEDRRAALSALRMDGEAGASSPHE